MPVKTKDMYADVLDGFAKLTGDAGLPDRVHALERQERMVTALLTARCRAGFGLDDFAARMGISRAELERIEEGTDADLSMNQIAAYVLALVSAIPARATGAAAEATPHKTASARATRPRKRAVALA